MSPDTTSNVIRVCTVQDAARVLNVPCPHPYVLVADIKKAGMVDNATHMYCIYGLHLKMSTGMKFLYGLTPINYQAGSMIFFAPGQTACPIAEEHLRRDGLSLYIDQRFIRGTALGQMIIQYKFFQYDFHQALFLNDHERDVYRNTLSQLGRDLRKYGELLNPLYIIRTIKDLLDLCMVAYKRSFTQITPMGDDLLSNFEHCVMTYLLSNRSRVEGLPTLRMMARACGLSTPYFGAQIKQNLGITPKQYVMFKWKEYAQEALMATNYSIERISEDLGFKTYNHFSFFFKKYVGMSPQQYRQQRRAYLEALQEQDKIMNKEIHWHEKSFYE